MSKGFKRLLIVLIVLITVAALVFLSVFLLAKQKKVFINNWFVNESRNTIGVDVSSYQADIDMNKLKEQNIQFIYIKATEGSSGQDSRFAENWENAKHAGLLSGAYHFFSFDSDGKTQAENFIKMVGPDLRGRLLPVVDVEYYGDKELRGEFDDYKKWMSSLYTPLSWNYKGDWYLWQYLNRGELEGYSGGEQYIDLNVLNKDKNLEDLIIR